MYDAFIIEITVRANTVERACPNPSQLQMQCSVYDFDELYALVLEDVGLIASFKESASERRKNLGLLRFEWSKREVDDGSG